MQNSANQDEYRLLSSMLELEVPPSTTVPGESNVSLVLGLGARIWMTRDINTILTGTLRSLAM